MSQGGSPGLRIIVFQICGGNTLSAYPQPVLSDIEFDVDGDMILRVHGPLGASERE